MRTSGRDEVIAVVGPEPALVVATPGAEPVADGGYAAALLLDGWALLDRPDLRASEEALRRWFAAAALVRPGPAGGRVVVMSDAGHRAVQSLVRWDPSGAADRELADRRELGFPPVTTLAEVSGPTGGVADLLAAVELPEGALLLGPQPEDWSGATGGRGRRTAAATENRVRAVVRVARPDGLALARSLAVAQAGRSARKAPDPVRVRIDPVDLG